MDMTPTPCHVFPTEMIIVHAPAVDCTSICCRTEAEFMMPDHVNKAHSRAYCAVMCTAGHTREPSGTVIASVHNPRLRFLRAWSYSATWSGVGSSPSELTLSSGCAASSTAWHQYPHKDTPGPVVQSPLYCLCPPSDSMQREPWGRESGTSHVGG